MTTLEAYDELRVPCYALPYLVNGDSSGLEPEDIAQGLNAQVIFSVGGLDSNESYFTNSPEFGLACDVEDCTILIVE
jgi:hypothetical protein